MKLVNVYNARDELEANMLTSVLEMEGIPCYSQESGAGEYIKITYGFSIYGRDIYVEDVNKDRAKEIIQREIKDVNAELGVNAEDEIDMTKVPWYHNKMYVARVLIGLVVVSMLCFYLVTL